MVRNLLRKSSYACRIYLCGSLLVGYWDETPRSYSLMFFVTMYRFLHNIELLKQKQEADNETGI